MRTSITEFILLCLVASAVVTALGLTGCAADVGKNNSQDLQNENTNLKLQLQQTKIERATFADSASATQRALDNCYKTKQ